MMKNHPCSNRTTTLAATVASITLAACVSSCVQSSIRTQTITQDTDHTPAPPPAETPKSHDPETTPPTAKETAESIIEKYNTPGQKTSQPSITNADIINKTRDLMLEGKTDEADEILSSNWESLTADDSDLSLDAHYLKGRICLDQALACQDKQEGSILCSRAIKSFHLIMAETHSEGSSLFTESLKYFKISRDTMQNKFGIEVPFPPEF